MASVPVPEPLAGPVVVAEFCPGSAVEILQQAGCRVVYDPGLARDPARLLRLLPHATGLVVRNQLRVDDALLEAAPRLRVVGRLGAGLDNIDGEAAARHGVTVVYAPGGNARAVAEFVLAQMLALARRLPAAAAMGASGRWARQSLLGDELAGTRVGILGLGRIGRALVPLLRPLVGAVATFHPRRGPEDPEWRELGIHWRPLEDLLAWSDYLVVLLPLRAGTRGLLDRSLLASLKPGARLVVTGRGGVVDEAALADLLRSGHLAGAALDVRALEPPGPCDPLRGLPNVVLTPHVAGLTVQAQERIGRSVAEDVLRVLRGLPPLQPAFLPATAGALRQGPPQG
ncbi:hydroxyacid dehydrogenase [Thermaerobacter subterraneus]|uniref:hydroxyacid dehydrogenase n=1 Tax=Thermaerobacter subterraneus TaxID=175696 RepID=UPI0002F83F76|nr:hydroxyacid dehydrogenase [Thermaerobacter subterraneus]